MFFAGVTLGAMAGAAFGIGLMCCVVAGKREDQQDGADADTQTKGGENGKQSISGIWKGQNSSPFWMRENLCMMAEDGTKEIGLCRFVDEKQVDVNGQVWEIGEFLWQMERRGIQVYPLQTA